MPVAFQFGSKTMRTIVLAGLLIALHPRVALPQAAEDPSRAQAPAPAQPSAGVTASSPAAPGEPAAPGNGDPVVLRIATPPPVSDFRVPSSYRPKSTGLETVYCKTYTPTGTRLRKTDCYTLTQVQQIERMAEQDRRQHREKTGTCAGACGG